MSKKTIQDYFEDRNVAGRKNTCVICAFIRKHPGLEPDVKGFLDLKADGKIHIKSRTFHRTFIPENYPEFRHSYYAFDRHIKICLGRDPDSGQKRTN